METQDELKRISPAPWTRREWTGEFISADGAGTDDFSAEDVAQIIWWSSTEDDWDGKTAGVVRLKDGRYAAWEAFWDCTGNGFCYDAYGGTSDIIFATTQEAAESFLGEEAKALPRLISH